jgi:hypothetical protein
LTRSGQCFSWVWTLAEKSEIRTNRCKHSVQNWDFSQIRWNRDNTEVIYRSSNQLMAIVMFGVNIAIKWLIIRWKHVLNQFAIYSSFTQTVVFLINKSVLIKSQSLTQLPEDLRVRSIIAKQVILSLKLRTKSFIRINWFSK